MISIVKDNPDNVKYLPIDDDLYSQPKESKIETEEEFMKRNRNDNPEVIKKRKIIKIWRGEIFNPKGLEKVYKQKENVLEMNSDKVLLGEYEDFLKTSNDLSYLQLEYGSFYEYDSIIPQYRESLNELVEKKRPIVPRMMKPIGKRKSKLKTTDPKIFERIIEESKNKHLSLLKIKEIYKETDNSVPISTTSIRKILRNKLNYSYRKPVFKTNKAITILNYRQKNIFLRKMIELVMDNKTIVYIDEASFKNDHAKFRTWVNKGSIEER